MESFGALLVAIADLYAIVRIIRSHAAVSRRALWCLLVLILPVAGFAVWFLLGPNAPRG